MLGDQGCIALCGAALEAATNAARAVAHATPEDTLTEAARSARSLEQGAGPPLRFLGLAQNGVRCDGAAAVAALARAHFAPLTVDLTENMVARPGFEALLTAVLHVSALALRTREEATTAGRPASASMAVTRGAQGPVGASSARVWTEPPQLELRVRGNMPGHALGARLDRALTELSERQREEAAQSLAARARSVEALREATAREALKRRHVAARARPPPCLP